MNELKTMSAVVRKIIDGYPAGHRFHGNQLKDDVVKIYPESQYQYVDTILRMARRHRRTAFRVVDKNKSLYEKVGTLSLVRTQAAKPSQQKPSDRRPNYTPKAVQLPLFRNQLFLVVFLLIFGAGFSGAFVLGRPLLPHSRTVSRSDFLYIPALPIYLKGTKPFRWSLLLTASEAIPNSWAMSKTVIPSIYQTIQQDSSINQVKSVKMFRHWHFLLDECIVKNQKKTKIREFFIQTLDYSTGWGYSLYSYYVPTLKQLRPLPEATEAEGSKRAKGDFYEIQGERPDPNHWRIRQKYTGRI